MGNVDWDEHERIWVKRFREASNEELKRILEEDRKKPGWVGIRGLFLDLLRREFERRGLEYK